MNNRDYKQFAAGEYYHLFNRGNGKMDIFLDAEDYQFLLGRLREYLSPQHPTMVPIAGLARRKRFPKDAFSVICYCLMPNHFHFLMRQNGEEPLSALMLNLWSGYSKYFNKKYNRVGSLFQDQFKSVIVESDLYLKWLSAYIHQNPPVAGLVKTPEEYTYSSYNEYVGVIPDPFCDKSIVMDEFGDRSTYRKFVADSLDLIKSKKEMERILID